MTVVMVVSDGRELTVGRLCAREPDVALVDMLMRWHLLARRRGWRMVVRDAPPAFVELLELSGLAGVLVLEPGG